MRRVLKSKILIMKAVRAPVNARKRRVKHEEDLLEAGRRRGQGRFVQWVLEAQNFRGSGIMLGHKLFMDSNVNSRQVKQ